MPEWPSDIDSDFDQTLDRYDEMFRADRYNRKLRRKAAMFAFAAMTYVVMWLLLLTFLGILDLLNGRYLAFSLRTLVGLAACTVATCAVIECLRLRRLLQRG